MYLLTMQASSIGTSEMSSICKWSYIIDCTYYVDSLALRTVLRLDDPQIALLFALEFVIMTVEISELIWQNVGVRNYCEFIFTELLLHLHNVIAKSILASKFVRLREVVYLLVFI